MIKQIILTGIRANNDLHIGNYFGALLPIVDMATKHADTHQVNLMLADLHSFSTPIDHTSLHEQIEENLKMFVAAGLPTDHENIRLFRESYVSAHSELAHIFDAFTGVGEMMRMTQFKDKSGKIGKDRVSMALLNYPPLMAADILLYQTSYVPVGDDQTQHLEYVRDIAERMNTRFQEDLFVVPKTLKKQHEFFGKDQGLRIKDLQDPTKKMSKSDDTGKGVIFLNEDPEAAAKKIMSATTDSVGAVHYDPENQPGISNLIQIYALLTERDVKSVAEEFDGMEKYGDFKKVVADQVSEFLKKVQDAYVKIDEQELTGLLKRSEETLNKAADETLRRVQRAVGLRG